MRVQRVDDGWWRNTQGVSPGGAFRLCRRVVPRPSTFDDVLTRLCRAEGLGESDVGDIRRFAAIGLAKAGVPLQAYVDFIQDHLDDLDRVGKVPPKTVYATYGRGADREEPYVRPIEVAPLLVKARAGARLGSAPMDLGLKFKSASSSVPVGSSRWHGTRAAIAITKLLARDSHNRPALATPFSEYMMHFAHAEAGGAGTVTVMAALQSFESNFLPAVLAMV